ncbi:STAS domain-containing protein [Streptomyces sp. NPDC002746]
MRISTPLHVDRHQGGPDTVIVLTGALDHDSAHLFTATMAEVLSAGVRAINVDLSAVAFCDCGGLTALLRAKHEARTEGWVFQAQAPSPAVLHLLALTGSAETLLGRQPGAPAHMNHAEAAR